MGEPLGQWNTRPNSSNWDTLPITLRRDITNIHNPIKTRAWARVLVCVPVVFRCMLIGQQLKVNGLWSSLHTPVLSHHTINMSVKHIHKINAEKWFVYLSKRDEEQLLVCVLQTRERTLWTVLSNPLLICLHAHRDDVFLGQCVWDDDDDDVAMVTEERFSRHSHSKTTSVHPDQRCSHPASDARSPKTHTSVTVHQHTSVCVCVFVYVPSGYRRWSCRIIWWCIRLSSETFCMILLSTTASGYHSDHTVHLSA